MRSGKGQKKSERLAKFGGLLEVIKALLLELNPDSAAEALVKSPSEFIRQDAASIAKSPSLCKLHGWLHAKLHSWLAFGFCVPSTLLQAVYAVVQPYALGKTEKMTTSADLARNSPWNARTDRSRF